MLAGEVHKRSLTSCERQMVEGKCCKLLGSQSPRLMMMMEVSPFNERWIVTESSRCS